MDAPAVALVWQGLLAQHTGSPLSWVSRAVLGLTVWLIYICDRLLDIRRPDFVPSTARHRFYRRHYRLALAVLCTIALADAMLIVVKLPRSLICGGMIPALCVAAYIAAVHLSPPRSRIPKALLVASLFVIGTFLVAWTNASHPWTTLWTPALTFFLLCLSNLVLIDIWEDQETADIEPGALRRGFPLWVAMLAVVCLILSSRPWYRAIALSSLLVLALFLSRRRLTLDARRASVDMALLTPLLFLHR